MRVERLHLGEHLVLGLLLVSPRAFGAPTTRGDSTVSLSWTGPEVESGCLGAKGLRAAVDDYLGRSAFSAAPSDLVVNIAMQRREASGWRAVVQVKSDAGRLLGERELVSEGARCSSLDEPLTLAVALMVDSDVAPPSEPAAAPEEKPASKRRAIAPSQQQTHVVRLRLDAEILGVIGALPAPTLGADVALELEALSWLAFRAHATALLPQARSVAGVAAARFGMFFGGVLACPELQSGGLRYGACLGAEAGILTAATHGFDTAESGDGLLLAGSANMRARLRLGGRSSLSASAGALVPFRRDRFVYDLDGVRQQIFEISGVCWVAGLGLGFQL